MKKLMACILALTCLSVSAVDLEVSVGQTTFQKPDNGIWWQNGFHYSYDLKSPSYSIGLSDYAFKNTRWRVAYTYLGTVSGNIQGVPDADYNGVDGCVSTCPPFNTYKTEGNVRGFSFTLAPEAVFNDFKVFIEGGAFVYLGKFRAQAWANNNPNDVWENHYREGWQVGPQLGLGITYKKVSVVLTAYKLDSPTPDINAVPNWNPIVTNLSLKGSF